MPYASPTRLEWQTIHVKDYDYTWLAAEKHFECELRDVDVGLIAEAVKGGRGSSWVSTSPADSHPHNVDITIYKNDPLTGNTAIKIQCFTWETWDSEGDNVKITGYVWGAPHTWKGYEDYIKHEDSNDGN